MNRKSAEAYPMCPRMGVRGRALVIPAIPDGKGASSLGNVKSSDLSPQISWLEGAGPVWTAKSRFDKHRPTLEQVIDSFEA
jgi:hypothetical protein